MFKKGNIPIKKKKKEEKPILPKEKLIETQEELTAPIEDIVFPDGFEDTVNLTGEEYLLLGNTTASGLSNKRISIEHFASSFSANVTPQAIMDASNNSSTITRRIHNGKIEWDTTAPLTPAGLVTVDTGDTTTNAIYQFKWVDKPASEASTLAIDEYCLHNEEGVSTYPSWQNFDMGIQYATQSTNKTQRYWGNFDSDIETAFGGICRNFETYGEQYQDFFWYRDASDEILIVDTIVLDKDEDNLPVSLTCTFKGTGDPLPSTYGVTVIYTESIDDYNVDLQITANDAYWDYLKTNYGFIDGQESILWWKIRYHYMYESHQTMAHILTFNPAMVLDLKDVYKYHVLFKEGSGFDTIVLPDWEGLAANQVAIYPGYYEYEEGLIVFPTKLYDGSLSINNGGLKHIATEDGKLIQLPYETIETVQWDSGFSAIQTVEIEGTDNLLLAHGGHPYKISLAQAKGYITDGLTTTVTWKDIQSATWSDSTARTFWKTEGGSSNNRKLGFYNYDTNDGVDTLYDVIYVGNGRRNASNNFSYIYVGSTTDLNQGVGRRMDILPLGSSPKQVISVADLDSAYFTLNSTTKKIETINNGGDVQSLVGGTDIAVTNNAGIWTIDFTGEDTGITEVVHDATLTGKGILSDPLKVKVDDFVKWDWSAGVVDASDSIFDWGFSYYNNITSQDVPYTRVEYRYNHYLTKYKNADSGINWWSHRDGDYPNRYMAAIDLRMIVTNPDTGANYARLEIRDGWYNGDQWSNRIRRMDALPYVGGTQIPSFDDFDTRDFQIQMNHIQLKMLVVDNLQSSSSTDALAAKQGKALGDRVAGLEANAAKIVKTEGYSHQELNYHTYLDWWWDTNQSIHFPGWDQGGPLHNAPGWGWGEFADKFLNEGCSMAFGTGDNSGLIVDVNLPLVEKQQLGNGVTLWFKNDGTGSSYFEVVVTIYAMYSLEDWPAYSGNHAWGVMNMVPNANLLAIIQSHGLTRAGRFWTFKKEGNDVPGLTLDLKDVYELHLADHEQHSAEILYTYNQLTWLYNTMNEELIYLATKVSSSTVTDYPVIPLDGTAPSAYYKGLSLEFPGTTDRIATGFNGMQTTYSDVVEITITHESDATQNLIMHIAAKKNIVGSDTIFSFAFHDGPDAVYYNISKVYRAPANYVYDPDWSHSHEGVLFEWKDYFLTVAPGGHYNGIIIKSMYPELTQYLNLLFLPHTSTSGAIVNTEQFEDLVDIKNRIPKNIFDFAALTLYASQNRRMRSVSQAKNDNLDYFNVDFTSRDRTAEANPWISRGRVSIGIEDTNNGSQLFYPRLALFPGNGADGEGTIKRQLNALPLGSDRTSESSFVPAVGDFNKNQFQVVSDHINIKVSQLIYGTETPVQPNDNVEIKCGGFQQGDRLLGIRLWETDTWTTTSRVPVVMQTFGWPDDGIVTDNMDLKFRVLNADTQVKHKIQLAITYLKN